ncbi:transcriptional repressor DicA [compost metagenome]
MNIGERLKEERARLGFNQAEFAAFAGVAKTSQFNYEKGDRSPDAEYLAAIAEKGVDVLYVVTGERKALPATCLTPEATEFFEVYQQVSESDRAVLFRTAQAFARSRD